ncbi:MAG: hypothetical protein AB8F78_06460 [Saprospiraceae bacterium]
MNKHQLLALVYFLIIILSCNKEKIDPFALPEGAYDCRGLWEEDPQGPVGNFSYVYDDVEYLGIVNGGFTENDLLVASFRVYREDCFSSNGITLSGLDLDNRDTIRDFTCFQTTCQVNQDCRTEIRRLANFEFLDHDNPLAFYSSKTNSEEFYYVITNVNRDDGYVRGSFGGTLYLDPSCASFIGYPESVTLSVGHFIIPI